MKKYFAFLFSLFVLFTNAQDTEAELCMQRIMAKQGGWSKLRETVKSSAADQAIQRRFYNAVHNPLQAAYKPKGIEAAYSGSFQPQVYNHPVSFCWYTVFGERYFCEGNGLWLNKFDINSMFRVLFNYVHFVEIYDTTVADNPLGYHVLREGIPNEIRPGIWEFRKPTKTTGVIDTLSKLWLITYDGQQPWSYVTRKEFLLKRKRFLLHEMAAEAPRHKERLQQWEQMKKQKELEWKGEPSKMASYLSGTHNPGIEREQAAYQKLMQGYEDGLSRLNEQLSAPEEELGKRAIVIKSSKNNFDYDFTDSLERFAELLIKPNPAYFRKTASPAIPQMITVAIDAEPTDPRSVLFAQEMHRNLDLDFIRSFIGKSAPGVAEIKTAGATKTGNNDSPANTTLGNSVKQSASSANTTKISTDKPNMASKDKVLTGSLSAPAGVPVTLSCNGTNDVVITPAKGANNLYNTTAIRFPKPLKDDEAYTVSVKKMASNMKAVVYNGSGKAPEGTGGIRIGIDFKYELVSRSTADKTPASFYETFAPAVGGYGSEEGRYLVFLSNTKGFEGADGKFRQVYWRDRNTGITKMISVSPNGEQGNGNCAEPSISADGKTVVFESTASNLVAGDNNNFKDVFLWRAATNSIELVSKGLNGGGTDGECFDAVVSGNGSFVVFTSTASNLSPTPKGRSTANVFLRDLVAGKTEMISVDPVLKSGGNGYKGSISFDGNRVSFCSPSPTLVPADNNGLWDIFLWQRGRAGLQRISLTHDGKERSGGNESASRQVASALSGNGRYVVYSTTASNMVPGDNLSYQDVFVYDIDAKKLQVASFTDAGVPGSHDSPIEQGERLAITFDGLWVAFPTKAANLGAQSSNIILYNTQTGKKKIVTDTRGSYVGRPAISYSGGYVVFGKGEAMDNRFAESGIFAHFTGNGPCRDGK